MATVEVDFLRGQLQERKRQLEAVLARRPGSAAGQAPRHATRNATSTGLEDPSSHANLEALLREVDSALLRFAAGTYGLCETCHDTIERDRLLADPLLRYCLDHLTDHERAALQHDLDLASELQRGLLPPANLTAHGWETSYHYAPLGPVSGDYCDLYPCHSGLFFMLGDVAGKGVAASMRMTQLHALFRSLIGMGLPLAEIVVQINRFLCDSGLSGKYATLVCGCAHPGGAVELFNAGHLPVIAVERGGVRLVESTGFPLGMFRDAAFPSASLQLLAGDILFLYTDGLSEAAGEDGEYGIERLTQLIARQTASCAAAVVSACLEDLRRYAGATPGLDDVTLLAIRHGSSAAA